jgi:hypothetical protein
MPANPTESSYNKIDTSFIPLWWMMAY